MTGIDFGATEIRAIVTTPIGEPLGLGVVSLPWLDRPAGPAETAEALAAAVAQADEMAGHRTRSFWAALGGAAIFFRLHKETIKVGSAEHAVTPADIQRALASVRGRSLLHWAIASSTLDGRMVLEDPVGEKGRRLEITMLLAGGSAVRTAEIRGVAAAAGFSVAGYVAGVMASAVVLTPAEREIGAAVLDLGATHTTAAVYARGGIRYAMGIGVGSHYVTKDLAVALGMPLDKAEELKRRVYAGDREDSVDTMADKVVRARAGETLEMIRSAIASSGWERKIPGGYVLTGGGTLPESLLTLARDCLGNGVRRGLPESGHLRGLVAKPAYAVILGLAPVIMQSNKSCLMPKGVGRWRSWYRQRHMQI